MITVTPINGIVVGQDKQFDAAWKKWISQIYVEISAPLDASSLTGATLSSSVVNSSLTSVGTLSGLTVTAPIVGSVTGNAATATKLQTARAINGISFDGTAPITVAAAAGTLTGSTLAAGVTASSLTSVGVLTALAVAGAVTQVTDLTTAGNTILGDSSTDTLNVGNGDIVKDGSGNTITKVTGTAPTLANSHLVMNLTTDTNLRISVRGTDGVLRTANITLS